jgi:hypothetical protein
LEDVANNCAPIVDKGLAQVKRIAAVKKTVKRIAKNANNLKRTDMITTEKTLSEVMEIPRQRAE